MISFMLIQTPLEYAFLYAVCLSWGCCAWQWGHLYLLHLYHSLDVWLVRAKYRVKQQYAPSTRERTITKPSIKTILGKIRNRCCKNRQVVSGFKGPGHTLWFQTLQSALLITVQFSSKGNSKMNHLLLRCIFIILSPQFCRPRGYVCSRT